MTLLVVTMVMGYGTAYVAHNLYDALYLNSIRLDVGLPLKPISVSQIIRTQKAKAEKPKCQNPKVENPNRQSMKAEARPLGRY